MRTVNFSTTLTRDINLAAATMQISANAWIAAACAAAIASMADHDKDFARVLAAVNSPRGQVKDGYQQAGRAIDMFRNG